MRKDVIRLLSVFAAVLFVTARSFSQSPDASRLFLNIDDRQGGSATLIYGNATNATYYVDDGTGGTTQYFESIAPPPPPDPAFDVRWKGIPGRNNTPIVDGLFPRDYRPIPGNVARKDTFLVQFKSTGIAGSASIWFTWDDAATLAAHCDSAFFLYNDGSGNVVINMFTQDTLEMLAVGDNAISTAKIYKYGSHIIDGVKDVKVNHPVEFAVKNNYPNPFNPSTNIVYTIAKNATVDLSIYNVLGQKIATLVTGDIAAGEHTTVWNGTTQSGAPVSSGVYFVHMNAQVGATGEVFTGLRKLLLMK
jgi:hypothetical protein